MNTKLILAALAAASLALPVMAGPFGPFGTPTASAGKDRQFKNEEKEHAPAVKSSGLPTPQGEARDGFAYVGGEAGWQLIPHTLTWSGGRLAHSDKCDHVIRIAKPPTTQEIGAARALSPG